MAKLNELQGSCTDGDIRRALLASLVGDGFITEELGIKQGSVIADVVVINDDHMTGYEIKSDLDSLARLPRQVKIYSEVFERCTLVTTHKHFKKASALTPKWWSVLVAEPRGQTTQLDVAIKGGINQNPSQRSRCELLWRDEALRLLRNAGQAQGITRRPRRFIWDRCCEVFTPDETQVQVIAFLKRRLLSLEFEG